jgi:DnaJ-class molecular chaperone
LHFSQAELKNAYREAVVKYHPDLYGTSSSRDHENAETLMKQINETCENPKKLPDNQRSTPQAAPQSPERK